MKRKPLSTPSSPSRDRKAQCTCLTPEQFAHLHRYQYSSHSRPDLSKSTSLLGRKIQRRKKYWRPFFLMQKQIRLFFSFVKPSLNFPYYDVTQYLLSLSLFSLDYPSILSIELINLRLCRCFIM